MFFSSKISLTHTRSTSTRDRLHNRKICSRMLYIFSQSELKTSISPHYKKWFLIVKSVFRFMLFGQDCLMKYTDQISEHEYITTLLNLQTSQLKKRLVVVFSILWTLTSSNLFTHISYFISVTSYQLLHISYFISAKCYSFKC